MFFSAFFLVLKMLLMFPSKAYNFVIGRNMKTPMFNMFAIVHGTSLNRTPKLNFAQYLLMCFVLYSLVLELIYQGGLFDILQSHDRLKLLQ